ncbi:universal stress protein [Selenomonas sp.]|uniref:universal stress protein n=1 Tax=Selenomonas sp. TaxID=2053611 RepID=UPI00345BA5F8
MTEHEKIDTAALMEEIKRRPPQKIKCQRILLPTDGSGQAFKAVSQAIHLAAAVGAEVTLLMVVDYNKNVAAFEQVSLSGYVPAELKIAAYQFLADLMHVIPREIRAHTRVEVGDPGEVILSVAEEEESDMIVMGTHGFGTFRNLLMGSVSSFVTRNAACPVLLCKGMPAEDWDEEGHYQGGAHNA